MQLIISFTIFSVVTDLSWTESSKESPDQNVKLKNLKMLKVDADSYLANTNPHLNTLWFNNPVAQIPHWQPTIIDKSHRASLRNRHFLTKLTKTFSDMMDPYFSKENFGPFERRPKPVTLVALRKKGVFPRRVVKASMERNSMEVAEQQSPYNDIGLFWRDDPYDLHGRWS